MNDDIDGMKIIDATQNAVIEAIDNVSELIAETGDETIVQEHHHELFYKSAEFWVGFAFVLVVVVLAKPVGRLLRSMLLKRRDEIINTIHQAEKLHDESQKLLAEYERKYLNAHAEAEAVLLKSQKEIELTKQEEMQKLDRELTQKRREADGIIASAQLRTMSEINGKAAAKAVQTAQKYLQDTLDQKKQSSLIDQSIENILSALKKS